MNRVIDHKAWPARAALLAGLGALLGLAFDGASRTGPNQWSDDPLRLALASFIAVGGITFAVTLERARWLWSLLFALGSGLVVALIFYWQGPPNGQSAGAEWRIVSALVAIAVAAPLFQTMRDEGRRTLGYSQVHAHAWTNLVLWFACWAFVLVSWLLAQLLAELFHLIGIDMLRDLLRKEWFSLMLVGAAFGAAAGLLRDRDKVLGVLQRLATTILSVLAPVLAVGLGLFVLALPITGLAPLWEKTSATTPILLVAIAGAFFLTNAVIGNSAEEEAKARIIRWSAIVLAAVMTPLAMVAAISTWLRIDQHGFTPERLWALVFVAAVLAVSITYLWTLIRGGRAWTDRIRPANIRLAAAICVLALALALPIFDFGAISTRDQLARLQSGRVKADEFDWAALRFDFGPSGRQALDRLAASGPPAIRESAKAVLEQKDRWAARQETKVEQDARDLAGKLRVLPAAASVPQPLVESIARHNLCREGPCTLLWQPGARSAVAVGLPCEKCSLAATRLAVDAKGEWQALPVQRDVVTNTPAAAAEQLSAIRRGEVEIRPVTRQQVFVGGKPVGEPFE